MQGGCGVDVGSMWWRVNKKLKNRSKKKWFAFALINMHNLRPKNLGARKEDSVSGRKLRYGSVI